MSSIDTTRKKGFSTECTEINDAKPKYWTPPALRAPVLILTAIICWALIAILEFLLHKSQRNNGLMFAPKINDLPLSETFLYRYFPTVLAVIFSIYWAWIDLETKRMEPYYQLSKKDGALGKDSLLLQYPFSFIPFVPFRALRDRHWSVFWAALAVVLVTWGIVPMQAGIFSTQVVTRVTNMTIAVSNSSMPFEDQAMGLTTRWTQSTYGIVALNETLPPFMARNYTLAPFRPLKDSDSNQRQTTYTAPTTMYTVDLYCEQATSQYDEYGRFFQSASNGCTFSLGLDGNKTFGPQLHGEADVKQYNGMFVGYHNGGFADYYLSSSCPESENTTFYAAFSKSKEREEDPPLGSTAVFCHPRYWRQDVMATVEATSKAPLAIEPLADKQPLEWYMFNRTYFDSMLNSGSLGYMVPGDVMPISGLPKYWDMVARTNITLTAVLQPMVGLALATGARPLEDYLDWQALSKAYADAYRLLFVRAMVDVLDRDFESSKEVSGLRRVTTEALVLEPVFVHIVVGLLGVVSLATVILLFLTLTRRRILYTDPSTLASMMLLVADNEPLLADFAELDCRTMDDVQNIIGQKRYKLEEAGSGARISEVDLLNEEDFVREPLSPQSDGAANIANPVRPVEFSVWVAIPFVNLFALLAVALGVLYRKAYGQGLPMPSTNTIVQNIYENYIPTAIATLIEPMWILINRLFCMLQPLEELHDCRARASRSIDNNYSSLPPQLVILKALKSKHFVLAAVCAMALLANVLAVAFSGLFLQENIELFHDTSFHAPYQFRMAPVNGSVGPGLMGFTGNFSGAYRGGEGEDQFYIAESNYTRNSSLPAWTDERMLHLPMFPEAAYLGEGNTTQFEGVTRSFGAVLDCEKLEFGKSFNAGVVVELSSFKVPTPRKFFDITVPSASGNVRCSNFDPLPFVNCTDEHSIGAAWEMVTKLQARPNGTRHENDVCMGSVILGWSRAPKGACPSKRLLFFDEGNALFVRCSPRLVTGSSKIRVDAKGLLRQPADYINVNDNIANESAALFSTAPIDVIGQSNIYLFPDQPAGWHNNSFGNTFINHFMIRASDRRIMDPSQPVPTFDEVIGPLNKAYSKLFAIWLGRNKENLFEPVANEDDGVMKGKLVVPARRLFLSTTMFIISEAILCTYFLVAIWVYVRRPGQYLPRLPTSIAAVIALFAASAAVQDMKGTGHLDKKGRAQHLERIGARYGYGSYVGADGRVHIGVEKTPFVRPKTRKTWLEKRLPTFRKGSLGTM